MLFILSQHLLISDFVFALYLQIPPLSCAYLSLKFFLIVPWIQTAEINSY